MSVHETPQVSRRQSTRTKGRSKTSKKTSSAKTAKHEFGPGKGLTVQRRFTQPGVDPYDQIEWEMRTASIASETGGVVFEQKDVEVPKSWSQTATNIVAQKYFRGTPGTPERERSVKQLISRVADTIAEWGDKAKYFATDEDRDAFHAELKHLLVNQMMAFNSPVWFNCGVETHPQVSACFINSVQDSMSSILELAKTEGMLFKFGSGTGSNLSEIRSSNEILSGGGTASGPVSFMRGYDAFAGVIKSGGKTRRAAKMVILNAEHPDIVEFIECKMSEEKKAHALIDAGYDPAFNVAGGAYDSVFFQNANHSVRVNDDFMRAVVENGSWDTKAVTSGDTVTTFQARDLMAKMAEATWQCGDPGMQFDTTINTWHTCKETGRINASNPCSEYMFLDDTACNLASLNLMKFLRPNGDFDVASFDHACRTTLMAQEILVDHASYPTPMITKNSFEYRPLGLGYANLGAMLMALGLPYDSDTGRAYAGAVTALMCGAAYRTSAEIARDHGGPFAEYPRNADSMMEVMSRHRAHAEALPTDSVPESLRDAAIKSWRDAETIGQDSGFRNAQATVLAPTGTIAFMMDCDTTGIEPDLAVTKYKKLVGGGMIKIVNNTVPVALKRLGYDAEQIQSILDYVSENETIEGSSLAEEHLPIFDCSFRAPNGSRTIEWMGHVRMMAAVQPFLSGAISKTVNMPEDSTVEDIAEAYVEAWRLGLKAIAIYRDGCKRTQPLSTSATQQTAVETKAQPARRRLPDERQAMTHKFSVAGHEGYITVGLYPDTGQPGEIFVVMAKQGSVVSGLMDSFATAISLALQYGVPLQVLSKKFSHVRFEPSGYTNNREIPIAKSIIDYIFRWLGMKFLDENKDVQVTEVVAEAPTPAPAPVSEARSAVESQEKAVYQASSDAPPCHECGTIMVRNGACYACINCGATSGCS